jgi:DedD protein
VEDTVVKRQTIAPQPGVSTDPIESPYDDDLRRSPRPVAYDDFEPVAEADYLATDESEPVVPEADNVAQAADAPAVVTPEVAPAKSTTRSASPEPLRVDSDGLPVGWILQVASVSEADKAEALRQQLLAIDQEAYVKRLSSNGKSLYRVYVGPKFEKAKLQAIQREVDRQFGVQSMVRRYVP